jgi:hypothetical protein
MLSLKAGTPLSKVLLLTKKTIIDMAKVIKNSPASTRSGIVNVCTVYQLFTAIRLTAMPEGAEFGHVTIYKF